MNIAFYSHKEAGLLVGARDGDKDGPNHDTSLLRPGMSKALDVSIVGRQTVMGALSFFNRARSFYARWRRGGMLSIDQWNWPGNKFGSCSCLAAM